MNYSQVYTASVSEGLGMRTVLFVSGCHHHCKGCFNKCTWDPNYGQEFTDEVAAKLIDKTNKPYIGGISLLGGEPFYKANRKPLLDFIRRFKQECPDKNIWCYTGSEYEDLLPGGKEYDEDGYELLKLIDVLVAGPFVLAQKDITLAFRGSSNQRIIDVQASLKKKEVVLLDL